MRQPANKVKQEVTKHGNRKAELAQSTGGQEDKLGELTMLLVTQVT